MVADQKNSEAYEFIEEISEKGLDLSYQILVRHLTYTAWGYINDLGDTGQGYLGEQVWQKKER